MKKYQNESFFPSNQYSLHVVEQSIELLKKMIQIPSKSREEKKVADCIESFLQEQAVEYERKKENFFAKDPYWNPDFPVILLNSHIDTVSVVEGWSEDPFGAIEKNGCIYGLGSNDAGASVVTQLALFRILCRESDRDYNLIWSATAEEEVSGKNGIEFLFPFLEKIDLAIVGEPTNMQMAIAEKGLMVIDATAKGKAGHAARNEGQNAIYKALKDIAWIESKKFEEISSLLGPVKMTVTQIEAGHQHNVVPDRCRFVIDVRSNECYSNREIFSILEDELQSELVARSYRLNSSTISTTHPLVERGMKLGLNCYGSPTMSDQALIPVTSVKIGPGDSARSHTADEFIRRSEIEQAVSIYLELFDDLVLHELS